MLCYIKISSTKIFVNEINRNYGTYDLTIIKFLYFHPQAMLSDPELDGGCIAHQAAAHIYLTAPHTYRQMALDCITASLRIDGKKYTYLYFFPWGKRTS